MDLRKLEETLKKGFNKEDGPFVRALDDVLSLFNVQRQAYSSGTFVGSHIHCCLEVYITMQCLGVTQLSFIADPYYNIVVVNSQGAREHCRDLLAETEALSARFQKAFSLFREFHVLYNSKQVSAEEINRLGRCIIYIIYINFIITRIQRGTSQSSWTSTAPPSSTPQYSPRCTFSRSM